MSLLSRLKAGKSLTRTIKFPGTDQDVAFAVLSNADIQDAHFAVEEHFKKNKVEASITTAELFEDETTTQILARALKDPEDLEKPFAKGANELRSLITNDEKNILVEEYNAFSKEVSPDEDKMSDEEIEALFEQLKKTPKAGSVLNLFMLRRLIIFLASRQQN